MTGQINTRMYIVLLPSIFTFSDIGTGASTDEFGTRLEQRGRRLEQLAVWLKPARNRCRGTEQRDESVEDRSKEFALVQHCV